VPLETSLKGRIALVTGSTSGIGLGIAEALAAEGADIALNGLGTPEAIEALRTRIHVQYGVRCIHHPADMSRPAQIAEMIHAVQISMRGLDILVNNAGIQHVAPIEQFPDDKWDAILAINLASSFHTIKAALPGMRSRGWGRIINIASAHGLVASAQKAAYVAAKHGLLGLTKVVALETAESGVTCNAICPGWVLTPLVQSQIEARATAQQKSFAAARKELLGEKQPSLEFVTPEQLGALAVFLCSPAAAQIRGASYSVDGGWVAQ
jgi:3-hydroxybutyrate dehydrogenase